jgi:hypothetical protein
MHVVSWGLLVVGQGIDIDPMRRNYLILVTIIAIAVLWFDNNNISAQEDDQPTPSAISTQQSPKPDGQEPIKGYPVRERRIGGPTDVEWDLDNSFPKRGSVLELILQCDDSQQQ